jgi:myosin-5
MTTSSVHQAVEVYTQGTKAWFEDDREAWVSSTCISTSITDSKVRLVFQSDNDDKVKCCPEKNNFYYSTKKYIGICI